MSERFAQYFAGFRWKVNIYTALARYLLLAMTLYSICRLGFYFFNISIFPGMTLRRFAQICFGGLRFDLVAVLYTNSLFILLLILPFHFRFNALYQKVLKQLFIFSNGLALAPNVADFIYFRFSLRRTNLSVLDQFRNEANWSALIFSFFLDYWYVVIFWMVLVIILIMVSRRIKFEGPQLKGSASVGAANFLMAVVVLGLFLGGVRGGFSGKPPISLINASEYAREPKDINLVLNTPFVLMKADRSGVITKSNYFASEAELRKAFDPVIIPPTQNAFRADNVVIIILESFSKDFIGAYNPKQGKGLSPFLDSLIQVSRAYQYSMANGIQSIDAMPSVICSIPRCEVAYLLSHYAGNKVNSLANLLKEKGYYSAYFHGAANGSMGFQAFANLCGFDSYFGMDEYRNDRDYDGVWGIWDEKFLHFFADKMNTFQTPFLTTLHTVSSHHPYNIPKEYEGKFKGGAEPIYRTVEYTDYALRQFFETASAMPWFKNTLFVFTADHSATWGNFSIPIFFYKAEKNWSSFKPEIVEQIDIMPTVLGYLQYDKPYVAFGRDIFREDKEPFAVTFDYTYHAYSGDWMLRFDGTKSTGLYQFKIDEGMLNDLSGRSDQGSRMEVKLKGLIQQYNNRMVDNNLTTDGPQAKVSSKQ